MEASKRVEYPCLVINSKMVPSISRTRLQRVRSPLSVLLKGTSSSKTEVWGTKYLATPNQLPNRIEAIWCESPTNNKSLYCAFCKTRIMSLLLTVLHSSITSTSQLVIRFLFPKNFVMVMKSEFVAVTLLFKLSTAGLVWAKKILSLSAKKWATWFISVVFPVPAAP